MRLINKQGVYQLGETEDVPKGASMTTQAHLIRSSSMESKGKNIMNPREIVQALLDSVQRGDFQKARFLVSKDCQFSGFVPELIKREAWMGINKNLKKACPNLDYHFHVDRVDGLNGHLVKIWAELRGTQSGVLDLSPVGLGVTPATNKSFATPREYVKVTIRDSKVDSWLVEPIEGAGLKAILGQLGVKLPTIV